METLIEKIKYTILRDSERKPTITICTIVVNGYRGTGIAIRSLNDNPVERVGKAKAKGRAIKAMVRRENSLPVASPKAFEAMSQVEGLGVPLFKSMYSEV